MNLIIALLEILGRLVAPAAAFLWAKSEIKNEGLKDDLEQKKHDAQAWADSPRSMDDFTDRLRALAAKKRKDRS